MEGMGSTVPLGTVLLVYYIFPLFSCLGLNPFLFVYPFLFTFTQSLTRSGGVRSPAITVAFYFTCNNLKPFLQKKNWATWEVRGVERLLRVVVSLGQSCSGQWVSAPTWSVLVWRWTAASVLPQHMADQITGMVPFTWTPPQHMSGDEWDQVTTDNGPGSSAPFYPVLILAR